jgi:tartrate dehydratase alpha subunit/fumarate hydratase class I-like protein
MIGLMNWKEKILSNIEIAKLLNVKVNTDTGQVFLEMEVTDPVWKQKMLREWQDVDVKLVVENKTGGE